MGIKERREREEQARLASILASAESVFAKKGYYETRMDDIADAAELAKGTLYYYFKSKDAIYMRLLERESEKVYAKIRARISKDASFFESLKEILSFYVEYFDKNKGFLRIFFPCMCGFIQFEDARVFRESTKSYERHAEFIRETLQKKMKQEKLSFGLKDLLKFIRTLQIGIGMRLLEGRRGEAENTARFFLDLMKKTMEKQP